jgi:hypothetical protein
MKSTNQNERMLNWLESEKNKDLKELEYQKKRFSEQIKKLNKDQLFPKPKKLNLWQRIKLIILGI